MIIKEITCQNFRQFKNFTRLKFSTDPNKLNIIYSNNGGGKTTLHQLFKWIFYDTYQFSNDEEGILYNVVKESELSLNEYMYVEGSIEYYCNHYGTTFKIKRVQKYKKEVHQVREIDKSKVTVLHINDKGDWVESDYPLSYFLNIQLPQKLSNYFLFDGERMVSEFSTGKSKESELLKKTFFSIFELNNIENAITHLDNGTSTCVVSKYAFTGDSGNVKLNKVKDEIKVLEEAIEVLKGRGTRVTKAKLESNDKIKSLSEQIGKLPTLDELEIKRNKNIRNIDSKKKYYDDVMKNIGELMVENFIPILLAKKTCEVQEILNEKQKNTKLPNGLNKELINFLIESDTCICGETINSSKNDHLKKWLLSLPPHDYKTVYNSFVNSAKSNISRSSDKIKTVDSKLLLMSEIDLELSELVDERKEIDESMKNSGTIERQKLVKTRLELEEAVKKFDKELFNINVEYNKTNSQKTSKEKERDSLLENDVIRKRNEIKLLIAKRTVAKLKEMLEFESKKKTDKLTNNIELLVKSMFAGQVTSSLNSNYELIISDDYGPKKLSEGQFAVITFAYIGGILKTLRDEGIDKKFPLILDGPFSKLDDIHTTEVTKSIPEFANQVIIFSKDNLDNYFKDASVGAIYEIVTNEQKNIATVEGREKFPCN